MERENGAKVKPLTGLKLKNGQGTVLGKIWGNKVSLVFQRSGDYSYIMMEEERATK